MVPASGWAQPFPRTGRGPGRAGASLPVSSVAVGRWGRFDAGCDELDANRLAGRQSSDEEVAVRTLGDEAFELRLGRAPGAVVGQALEAELHGVKIPRPMVSMGAW